MSKRIGRRSIAALLAAVMMFTAVPIPADATGAVEAVEEVGAADEVLEEVPDESRTDTVMEVLKEEEAEKEVSEGQAAEEVQPSKSEESSESETEQTEDQAETEAAGEDKTDTAENSEEVAETEAAADSIMTEESTEEGTEEAESENGSEIEAEAEIAEYSIDSRSVIGDDYPYKNYCAGCHSDDIDPWNFYYRQCTSFAAWRLNSQNGVAFTNSYSGVRWGNAGNWGTAARNAGITVDNTPSVGSIWWSSAGTYGHVAWVAEVNGDQVTIEEYNYRYAGNYGTRTLSASSATGYIHIKDMNPIPIERGEYMKTGYSQTIPDGDYHIVSSLGDNWWLTNAGFDMNDGGNVQLWDYSGLGAECNDHVYRFQFIDGGDGRGFYKITNLLSGKCLDSDRGDDLLYDPNTGKRTNIHQWTDNGSAAQQWAINAIDGGGKGMLYTFQARCSGYYMDVEDAKTACGTNISMWKGNGSAAQQWRLVLYAPKLSTPASTLSNDAEVDAGTKFYLDKNGADTLYYTWDGTTPTRQSTQYSDSTGLTIPTGQTTCTLKAIGVREGCQDSDILEITYTVKQKKPSGEEGGNGEEGGSTEGGGSNGEGGSTEGGGSSEGGSTNPEDDDLQDGVKWHYNEQNVAYKDLSQYGQITTTIKPKTYDGTPYKPAVKVTSIENGKTVTLTEGPDYRVLYYNNLHAGTGSVTVKGNGVYKGTISRKFEIKKKSCKKLKVVTNSMLTGDSRTPEIYVYDGNILLKENEDYILDGITPNFTATKGTKQIYVMAAQASDYEGMITAKITIYDADKGRIKGIIDSSENVNLSQSTYQYTGKACKPTATVTVEGNTLTPGKDYTIKYRNNKDAGTAFATITGKGSYAGSIVKKFTIKPSNAEITLKKAIAAVTYNGRLQKPKITVIADGKTLKLNKDYTLSYADNLHATGSAKVTVRGKGNYADVPAKVFYFTINPCHIKKASVKGASGSLLITHAKHTLVEGVDYDVIYGAVAGKGKISVTIKAKEGGSFTGEVTKKVKQQPSI